MTQYAQWVGFQAAADADYDEDGDDNDDDNGDNVDDGGDDDDDVIDDDAMIATTTENCIFSQQKLSQQA